MSKPTISIIAAIGLNRELGKNNKLLWNIPEDMKRFREVTTGHTVIMGRNTYQSIGRLLPERVNIIISRDKSYKVPGGYVVHSLEEAIDYAKKKDKEEIFIIGGGQIYEQGLKYADKLYLTIINGKFDADIYFPDYSEFKKKQYCQDLTTGKYNITFLELTR